MVIRKEPYRPMNTQHYQELIKQKTIASLKKRMEKMGIQIHELSTA